MAKRAKELTGQELAEHFPSIAGSLKGEDLETLRAAFDARDLVSGEELLLEGEPSASLYLLWSGMLRVRVTAMAGSVEVATIAPGNLVAELSFIDGGPSSATISAAEPVEMLALRRDRFEELVQSHPAVAAQVLSGVCTTLARRIRSATGRFEHLAPGETVEDEEEAPRLLDRIFALFGLSRS